MATEEQMGKPMDDAALTLAACRGVAVIALVLEKADILPLARQKIEKAMLDTLVPFRGQDSAEAALLQRIFATTGEQERD